MAVIDKTFLGVRDLLDSLGLSIFHRLQEERLAFLRAQFSQGLPSAIQPDETDSFLLSYGAALAHEITRVGTQMDADDVLFIFCRLPHLQDWRNQTPASAENRRTLMLSVAAALPRREKPRSELERGPLISDRAIQDILRLENLCAELLWAETVYRTVQKSHLFGQHAGVTINRANGRFHTSASDGARRSVTWYEKRKMEGTASPLAELWMSACDPAYLGISLIPRIGPEAWTARQRPICPGEPALNILEFCGKRGSYLSIPVNVVAPIKRITDNCSVESINRHQPEREALMSLLCCSAIRLGLYRLRCTAISENRYAYDLEAKGYMAVATPEVFVACAERIVEALNLPLSSSPSKIIDSWIQKHTPRSGILPRGIDWTLIEWAVLQHSDRSLVCFPGLLPYIEHRDELILGRGGDLGTFDGMQFEEFAVLQLARYTVRDPELREWVSRRKIFSTRNRKNNVCEIDYAFFRGDVLFLVDMKDVGLRPALSSDEAEKHWKKAKDLLKSVEKKGNRLIEHWETLEPAPPSSVRYIVPIACMSGPNFLKLDPPYLLWDDRHGQPVARACTVEELLRVLPTFDFEGYKKSGGRFLTVPKRGEN